MDEESKKVLSRLQGLCSRQECCTRDLQVKAGKTLSPRQAAEVIASLVEDKYVDDYRYACAFAREKSSITGWGPLKIRMALSAKGIDRETADSALQELDSEKAQDRLNRLVANKYRSLSGDPQAKLKLLRFALGRGYGYEEVREAIDRVFSSSD